MITEPPTHGRTPKVSALAIRIEALKRELLGNPPAYKRVKMEGELRDLVRKLVSRKTYSTPTYRKVRT